MTATTQRQTRRDRARHTDTETDTQIRRQTYRDRDRHTEAETDTERGRERDRKREAKGWQHPRVFPGGPPLLRTDLNMNVVT